MSKSFTIKIGLIIFFSFGIIFSSLYFMDDYLDSSIQEQIKNETIETNDEDVGTRIFILGSSRMWMLDPVYIDEYILKNGYHVDVYNLGTDADKPTKRIESIDEIISWKPDIVAYGIDFEDVMRIPKGINAENMFRTSDCRQDSILPNNQFFDIISDKIEESGIKLTNFDNPKLTTLKLVSKIIPTEAQNEESKPEIKRKFGKFSPNFQNAKYHKLLNPQEIENMISEKSILEKYADPRSSDNLDTLAFKKIIEKLTENNIKIIIFTTPFYKSLSESSEISKCNIVHLEKLLDDISNEYNIVTYQFHNKYSDLPIWRDYSHISHDESGLIFSTDISKIIISEIER